MTGIASGVNHEGIDDPPKSMPAHYARNETAARGAIARLRYQKA